MTTNKTFVEGYAVVFDSLSEDLGGFYEIIHKGAITQELIDRSDVFVKLDHQTSMIIARSNKNSGSLKLTLDDKGLKYRFELPDSYKGDVLKTHIQRGEISKSSFSFMVNGGKDSEYWEMQPNGTVLRHIYSISGLYDVSPVWQPAYPETTCYLIDENINIEDTDE